MKYALSLAEDCRILSVTFDKYAPSDAILVDELPEGNICDFRYVNNCFVKDPNVSNKKELAEHKIQVLKQKLAETDYNILKIVEGAATLTEMSDIISQRSKWRAEINELEKDLTI